MLLLFGLIELLILLLLVKLAPVPVLLAAAAAALVSSDSLPRIATTISLERTAAATATEARPIIEVPPKAWSKFH